MWAVVFYPDDDGAGISPVQKFLDGLDNKTLAWFLWSIEELQKPDMKAWSSLGRYQEDGLWALSKEVDADEYSNLIFYFFMSQRIVFLHGIQTKVQDIPRHEIEIAKQRLETFRKRAGNGTKKYTDGA